MPIDKAQLEQLRDNHKTLTWLALNDITDDDIIELATALDKNTTLTDLQFQRSKITDKSVMHLATVLSKTNISSLYLSYSGITGEAVRAILRNGTNLTQLYCTSCNIDDTGATQIAETLPVAKKLKILDLEANKISDAGIAAIAAVLPQMLFLTDLKLNANKIGSKGAVALAAVLTKLPMGFKFSLAGSPIGDEGAEAIASALPNAPQLKWLILHSCQITDRGGKALGTALAKTKIEQFELSYNLIGDETVRAIAESLPFAKSLAHLGFSSTTPSVSDVGIIALSKALLSAPHLQVLCVSGGTDAGITQLVQVLPRTNLSLFSLFSDEMTDVSAKAFYDVLPQTKIMWGEHTGNFHGAKISPEWMARKRNYKKVADDLPSSQSPGREEIKANLAVAAPSPAPVSPATPTRAEAKARIFDLSKILAEIKSSKTTELDLSNMIVLESQLTKYEHSETTSEVNALAVLSDKRLVSCDQNHLKIWDTDKEVCLQTFKIPGNSIFAIFVYPGNKLLCCARDGVKLLDLEKMEWIQNISIKNLQTAALLQDGSVATSCSEDKDHSIKIFNLSSGKQTGSLAGHTDSVTELLTLNNGQLASGSKDGTIRAWDVSADKCVQTLHGYHNATSNLVELPGDCLASGVVKKGTETQITKYGDIKIWDLKSGKHSLVPSASNFGEVSKMTLFPDGRLVCVTWIVGRDPEVYIWELNGSSTYECVQIIKETILSYMPLIVFSDIYLAYGTNGRVQILKLSRKIELADLVLLFETLAQDSKAQSLGLQDIHLGDNAVPLLIALFVKNKILKQVDLRNTGISKRGIQILRNAIKTRLQSLIILTDYPAEENKKEQAVDFGDFSHLLLDKSEMSMISLEIDGLLHTLQLSRRRMLPISMGSKLRVLDIISGKCLFSFAVPISALWSLNQNHFLELPGDRLAITSSSTEPDNIGIFDLETRDYLVKQRDIKRSGNDYPLPLLLLSKDRFVTYYNGCIWMFDVQSGKCIVKLQVASTGGEALSLNVFALTENMFLITLGERNVQLWDLQKFCFIKKLAVQNVEFAHRLPDGSVAFKVYIYKGSYPSPSKSRVEIWDIEKDKCMHTLPEVETASYRYQLQISSDGRYLRAITGCVIQLWNLETKSLCSIRNPSGRAFSASNGIQELDNDCLMTFDDHYVRVWDVTTGACLRSVPHEFLFRRGRYPHLLQRGYVSGNSFFTPPIYPNYAKVKLDSLQTLEQKALMVHSAAMSREQKTETDAQPEQSTIPLPLASPAASPSSPAPSINEEANISPERDAKSPAPLSPSVQTTTQPVPDTKAVSVQLAPATIEYLNRLQASGIDPEMLRKFLDQFPKLLLEHGFLADEIRLMSAWFGDYVVKLHTAQIKLDEISCRLEEDAETKRQLAFINGNEKLKQYHQCFHRELCSFLVSFSVAPTGFFELQPNAVEKLINTLTKFPVAGDYLKVLMFGFITALRSANERHRMTLINRTRETFGDVVDMSEVSRKLARHMAMIKRETIKAAEENVEAKGVIAQIKGLYEIVKEKVKRELQSIPIMSSQTGMQISSAKKMAILHVAYFLEKLMAQERSIDLNDSNRIKLLLELITGEPVDLSQTRVPEEIPVVSVLPSIPPAPAIAATPLSPPATPTSPGQLLQLPSELKQSIDQYIETQIAQRLAAQRTEGKETEARQTTAARHMGGPQPRPTPEQLAVGIRNLRKTPQRVKLLTPAADASSPSPASSPSSAPLVSLGSEVKRTEKKEREKKERDEKKVAPQAAPKQTKPRAECEREDAELQIRVNQIFTENWPEHPDTPTFVFCLAQELKEYFLLLIRLVNYDEDFHADKKFREEYQAKSGLLLDSGHASFYFNHLLRYEEFKDVSPAYFGEKISRYLISLAKKFSTRYQDPLSRVAAKDYPKLAASCVRRLHDRWVKLIPLGRRENKDINDHGLHYGLLGIERGEDPQKAIISIELESKPVNIMVNDWFKQIGLQKTTAYHIHYYQPQLCLGALVVGYRQGSPEEIIPDDWRRQEEKSEQQTHVKTFFTQLDGYGDKRAKEGLGRVGFKTDAVKTREAYIKRAKELVAKEDIPGLTAHLAAENIACFATGSLTQRMVDIVDAHRNQLLPRQTV